MNGNEEAVFMETVTLSDAAILGETSLRRRLHSHDLRCSEKSDYAFIGAPEILEQCKALFYH